MLTIASAIHEAGAFRDEFPHFGGIRRYSLCCD
jgi:hypothetical protein